MDMIGYWVNAEMTNEKFDKYIFDNEFEEYAMPVVKEFRRMAKKKVKTT